MILRYVVSECRISISALIATFGDVNAAVERLLQNQPMI